MLFRSDKWGLGFLTARVDAARSFAPALLGAAAPRDDTPASIDMPTDVAFAAVLESVGDSEESMNDNQRAIVAYSRLLEGKIAEEPALKVQRFLSAMEGTQAQFRVARERAQLFVDQMTARVARFAPP